MANKTLIVILTILVGLTIVYGVYSFTQKADAPTVLPENSEKIDPLNATYYIDNQSIELIDGQYESVVSGSITKVRYQVWDMPVYGDLNGDNINDAVVIIVNEKGGSGTFYYLAVALGKDNSTTATGINGIFLGDRIDIRDISIKGKEVLVDYLDRKVDEPMVVLPSIAMSLKFIVENGVLTQVPDITTDSQSCIRSGGKIESSLCCRSVGDFPNSCLIGACGCSPVNSHEVQICECGEGRCFNGNQCVNFNN